MTTQIVTWWRLFISPKPFNKYQMNLEMDFSATVYPTVAKIHYTTPKTILFTQPFI